MQELEKLIEVMEASAEKNGPNKTLTLGHFLNILKKVRHELEFEDYRAEMEGNRFDADF
jgi:hypothetical protein